jgi:hypothetical protein
LILVCASASAQSYRCSNGAYSDRPCAGAQANSLRSYGPATHAQVPYTSATPTARAPKVQDHVKYLTPECSSISEAIRTAPSRGVRGDTIAGLQEEYRQKCQYEDQDARRQVSQDASDQRNERIAQRNAAAIDRRQNQARADQCASMRDVIASKRARESTLNDSEVNALRSLERAFNERCIAR